MAAPFGKRCLHDSPFPYFSQVYLTILSVFQSFAIAGVITVAIQAYKMPTGGTSWDSLISIFRGFSNHLAAIIFAITLWHKYANHHQFIGWQLKHWDTLIVFGFGAIEALMLVVLTTGKRLDLVQPIMGIGTLFGVLAYWYAKSQFCKEYVRDVYREHYCPTPHDCRLPQGCQRHCEAKDVYYALLGFEQRSIMGAFYFGLAITIFGLFAVLVPAASFSCSVLNIILMVVFLLRWDLCGQISDEDSWNALIKSGKDIWERVNPKLE